MIKIYKRTIRITSPENTQRLEYRVEKNTGPISKILAVPAVIAGLIAGTIVFSVFFALLLVPIGILGFKVWRMSKTVESRRKSEVIDADYTVVPDSNNQPNKRN